MKTEERQKFLIIMVMIVAGLFVGERVIFKPLLGLWRSRADSISSLRTKVANGHKDINREAYTRSRWNEMSSNTLTNDQPQAAQKVLQAVAAWAKTSGATINTITPQWKNDATDYMTLNCRIDATGDIRKLSRLMYEIEKDPMALKLDSVELTAKDNSGAQMQLGLQINGLALLTPTTTTPKKR